MAGAYCRTPVIALPVEVLPIGRIEPVGFKLLPGPFPQQPVLDEVSRKQGRAVRIEGFKNGLGFVRFVEIEHDKPQMIFQCAGQCLGAFARTVLIEPRRELAPEIGVGFRHTGVRQGRAILGGGVHHVTKGRPIFIGRPHLVAFLFLGIGGITGQRSYLARRDIDGLGRFLIARHDRSQTIESMFRRLQNKLQGCKTLLAVNYFSAREAENRIWRLIEYDCPEEVRRHRLAPCA